MLHLRLRVAFSRKFIVYGCHRQIFTSPVQYLFYEKSKKGNYDKHTADKIPKKQLVLDGLKLLKEEIKLWKEEAVEKLKMDPIMIYRPGEIDAAFKFTSQQELDKWVVSADSDHNEGFSTAKFEMSQCGYGLFSGNVQSLVPKDGRVFRAGYCNIKSMRARKSFKRETYYDWTMYNTLGKSCRCCSSTFHNIVLFSSQSTR